MGTWTPGSLPMTQIDNSPLVQPDRVGLHVRCKSCRCMLQLLCEVHQIRHQEAWLSSKSLPLRVLVDEAYFQLLCEVHHR
jgi:hypothetical protein